MSKRTIQITDPDAGVFARIDPTSQALLTVEAGIAQTNEGRLFSAGVSVVDVSAGARLEMLIRTGASGEIHFVGQAVTTGNAEISLFENTVVSDDGSAIVPVNRNRNSANVSSASVFSGPTVDTDGDVLSSFFTNGGEKKDAFGSSVGTTGKWILAPSTNYLIRVGNLSGSNAVITITTGFYDTSL